MGTYRCVENPWKCCIGVVLGACSRSHFKEKKKKKRKNNCLIKSKNGLFSNDYDQISIKE